MAQRQQTTPILWQGTKATRLYPVGYGDHPYLEAWLQKLLFENPTLIPIDEIEPVFDGLRPVARELPTDAGPVDLVYVNQDGFLTIVETKLWRNPESRRAVVSQIIDYAKEIARWSYPELVEAVRSANRTSGSDDPLLAAVRGTAENLDEKRFVDSVSRNLRYGRFLLLIIGDGIQEGVERMVDFLQQTPRLGFTMALVEMSLFRLDPEKPEPLLVQPRILARTVEVTRAIVEIRTPISPADITVTLPVDDTPPPAKGGRITEQAFFEELAKVTPPAVVEFTKWAIAEAPKHDLYIVWRDAGPALRFKHPDTPQKFSIAYFQRNGEFGVGWFSDQCQKAGIPYQIGEDYFVTMESLVPGIRDDQKPIASLIPKGKEWFEAIDRAIEAIRKALAEK